MRLSGSVPAIKEILRFNYGATYSTGHELRSLRCPGGKGGGVTACPVSLLTNSMGVERTASAEQSRSSRQFVTRDMEQP